jgi:hypothetical protein
MSSSTLAELCERGSELLIAMDYLGAESALMQAERLALAESDFDALSRLYMPLQETRRQQRQRCGEGIVCLDLCATGPADRVEARHVLEHYPHGQLLVAGWQSIEPAVKLRALAKEKSLFVETFLGAVYKVEGRRLVVIAPFENSKLPGECQTLAELKSRSPAGSVCIDESELPAGPRKGTFETYGQVMAIWEKLAAPFLAATDALMDPRARIEGYRTTIQVDHACELAHQRLSDAAKLLMRTATAKK